MKKTALITGIAGQDGSYLAELLLGKGYTVSGVVRPSSTGSIRKEDNLIAVREYLDIITGDLFDPAFVLSMVERKFDEIYNLASVSTVQHAWEDPLVAIESTGFTPLRFLEAIRILAPETCFFQASSSEMFGNAPASPQNETTPFSPQKPYAYGKVLAHEVARGFRKNFGVRAVAGILYNHESPRRADHFLTRKVTRSLAKIKLGFEKEMLIGNLEAVRDWGYAPDYVRAMHAMLQSDIMDDYVIATGAGHTVRQFVEAAALELAMPLHWEGIGVGERGLDENGKVVVVVAKEFYRPLEPQPLIGDSSKLRKLLSWKPSISFEEMVALMVRNDIDRLKQGSV